LLLVGGFIISRLDSSADSMTSMMS
jgi:hypothetical protein